MPTMILQDVPVDVLEKIGEHAASHGVSPEEEAKRLLLERFGDGRNSVKPTPSDSGAESVPPLPDEPFLTGEMSIPFDLPRPGEGVLVKAVWGKPPLPDPIDTEDGE